MSLSASPLLCESSVGETGCLPEVQSCWWHFNLRAFPIPPWLFFTHLFLPGLFHSQVLCPGCPSLPWPWSVHCQWHCRAAQVRKLSLASHLVRSRPGWVLLDENWGCKSCEAQKCGGGWVNQISWGTSPKGGKRPGSENTWLNGKSG